LVFCVTTRPQNVAVTAGADRSRHALPCCVGHAYHTAALACLVASRRTQSCTRVARLKLRKIQQFRFFCFLGSGFRLGPRTSPSGTAGADRSHHALPCCVAHAYHTAALSRPVASRHTQSCTGLVRLNFFFFFFFFFFRDVHFCFRDQVAPIQRALTGRIVTCWQGRNVRIRTADAAG
jgi:hypothetical protein